MSSELREVVDCVSASHTYLERHAVQHMTHAALARHPEPLKARSGVHIHAHRREMAGHRLGRDTHLVRQRAHFRRRTHKLGRARSAGGPRWGMTRWRCCQRTLDAGHGAHIVREPGAAGWPQHARAIEERHDTFTDRRLSQHIAAFA